MLYRTQLGSGTRLVGPEDIYGSLETICKRKQDILLFDGGVTVTLNNKQHYLDNLIISPSADGVHLEEMGSLFEHDLKINRNRPQYEGRTVELWTQDKAQNALEHVRVQYLFRVPVYRITTTKAI